MDEAHSNETNSLPNTLLGHMDHQEAVRQMAVERYLLNEMTQAARDEFEQHFFDCPDCAADLRATAAFLDQSKIRLGETRRPLATPPRKSWFAPLFRPAFVSPVFAAMLLLIIYQNFSLERAGPEVPELLPAASLVAGNSRGGTATTLVVASAKAILLSVDIPAREEFGSYELALVSPAGETLWRMPISAEQAKDTVSVRVPTAHWAAGEYRLLVYGRSGTTPQPNDLAQYRFDFSR